MNNKDIRLAIQENNLRNWQVAKKYGCAEATFSRKLREELTEEEKRKILTIIEKLSKEK